MRWAKGELDQSAAITRDLVADTRTSGHPLALCLALTWCGATIPLRMGDVETAERAIALLKQHIEKQNFTVYQAYAVGLDGILSARRGDNATGERLIREALPIMRQAATLFYTRFVVELADVLVAAGDASDSLAAADEALERTERSGGRYYLPEVLRIKGEALRLNGAGDLEASEQWLRRSLAVAQEQGAASWELRGGISLGRLYGARNRPQVGLDVLQPVFARFSDGPETVDLRSARDLIQESRTGCT